MWQMKRTMGGLVLGLLLMVLSGASVALAKVPPVWVDGQPDSIVVMAGAGGKPMFNVWSTDGVAPPEMLVFRCVDRYCDILLYERRAP